MKHKIVITIEPAKKLTKVEIAQLLPHFVARSQGFHESPLMFLKKAKLDFKLESTDRLANLQKAVQAATVHLVDYGKIELGTPQSKALIDALKESNGLV